MGSPREKEPDEGVGYIAFLYSGEPCNSSI